MIERRDRLDVNQIAAVRELLAAEEARCGRHPLDEVNRLSLSDSADLPRQHWLQTTDGTLTGFAIGSPAPDQSIELAAVTDEHATSLLREVLAQAPQAVVWTHGDTASGRAAAETLGLVQVRELVLLARSLPVGAGGVRPLPPGVTVDAFDPSRDASEWLDLNRLAFADLPDQAGWTDADLQLRLAAPWFDAADFLIARDASDRLVGFHWTKIDQTAAGGRSGEVFVIAVSPAWRGTGLAGALLDAGLAHLAERGLSWVHLYVDAGNRPALDLYRRAGFDRIDGDRQYRLT